MDIGKQLSESELCPPDLLSEQEAAFARDIARIHLRSSEFLHVPCPGCASLDCAPEFEKFGFFFKRCASCATIFMSPRPSEDVLTDYYSNSENYQIWAEQIFPASEIIRREKLCRPWLERVVDHCERYGVELKTLVEVGPGFGTFAQVATESGQFTRVIAVEPTPELASACRKRGVEVIQNRVEDLLPGLLPEASVVVAFEVIEHLFEPTQFLLAAHSLLQQSGLLILSCPNGRGFDIEMLGAKSLAVDAEHVNLFNPDSLVILLARCGFEVLDISTPGRLDSEFVREAAKRGEIDLDAFLNTVLITKWDELGWPFQQFLASNMLSSHMWCVARKAR